MSDIAIVAEVSARGGATDRAHGGAVVATASVAPIEALRFTLRAPLALASLEQPAGSYADAVAFGNVGVGATYRRWVTPRLALETGLEVGLPTAHDDSLGFDRRALVFADVLFGGRSQALFVTGYVPFVSSVGTRFETKRWFARLGSSVVTASHGALVVEGGGGFRLTSSAAIEADARVFWLGSDPVVSLDPRLLFRLSPFFIFGVEASVPLGHGAGVGTLLRVTR